MSIEKLLIQILTNQIEIKQELENINERLDQVENTIRKRDEFTQTPTEQKASRLLQWMRDNKLNEVTRREVQRKRVAGCRKSSDVDVLFREVEKRENGKILKKGRSIILSIDKEPQHNAEETNDHFK
jgi:hypothetical protein